MQSQQKFNTPITQYSAEIIEDGKLSVKASGSFPLSGYSFQVRASYNHFFREMFVSVSVTLPETLDEEFVGPVFPEFQQILDIPKKCKRIIVAAEDKEHRIAKFTL